MIIKQQANYAKAAVLPVHFRIHSLVFIHSFKWTVPKLWGGGKRLNEFHVTWFGWFLLGERDSAPHSKKWSFMFSEPLAKIKNKTIIKTSLRARGPPGVSRALRSVRILRIGRIGSDEWTNVGNSEWGYRGRFRIQPLLNHSLKWLIYSKHRCCSDMSDLLWFCLIERK